MRLAALLALALAGCAGSKGQGARDAGAGDAQMDAPATNLRFFDVTAGLAGSDAGIGVQLPPVSTFTMVLDAEAGRIIVGAMGVGSVVPVTASGGSTFKTTKPFSVGSSAGTGCSGASSVTYEAFEITVAGTSLTGRASGAATISCGDCLFNQPFTAIVSGTADAKAPFLLTLGSTEFDPFAQLAFVASEPLPTTATASLVGLGGGHVDLVPHVEMGDVPLVLGFAKPDVVLDFGEQYTVALGGLVDFAGHAGMADTPLRLGGTPAPPPAAEDGFEAAAGATLGGAAVVTDPLVVLAGTHSLYLGGADAPKLGTLAAGDSLVMRLAVQPGDTVVRFAARGAGKNPEVGFAGEVLIGSEGRPVPAAGHIGRFGRGESTTVGGATVFLSPPATTEIPLPPDRTDEVIVSIQPTRTGCGNAPPAAGLVVDDLRAE